MPDAGAIAVVAGEDAGASGGAGRADVEVGQAYCVTVKAIEVGGLYHGIAMAAEVAITLVVGEYEDDIGKCSHEIIVGETSGGRLVAFTLLTDQKG